MTTIRYNWDLVYFGMEMGIVSIAKGHYINGLKQLLAPILYWRFPEFSECLFFIDSLPNRHLKVLDIGSPKLLSLYLALKRGHKVFATDLQDQQIIDRYKQHFEDWCSLINTQGEYIVEFQDARSLSYANDTFDVVFSLEVMGHIPDDGDVLAMHEICRVLRKGGIAIIAVPYSIAAKDLYVRHKVYNRPYKGEPVFYLRHYDDDTLYRRIINPSRMKVLQKTILGERLNFELRWNALPLVAKVPFMWSEPIFSRVNLVEMETKAIHHDMNKRYKCAMNSILILIKS